MGFFDKILGKKTPHPKVPATPPAAPVKDPSKDPNMIRVFDGYGRELFVTKQAWKGVLADNIKKTWNNPDELYNMIVSALHDGFRSDVVNAAKRLYDIDSNHARAATVWAIVLREEGRLDESEKVLRNHLKQHGDDGMILTNLAKIYAAKKNDAKTEEILWHALEIDPNQENGMGWYEVIHREREGPSAGLSALRRVASLPNSWRAQLWLARAALEGRDLDTALAYYNESLSRCCNPAPVDLLMQMSGDLGNKGYLLEIIRLAEPRFNPQIHGLQVGNNLIKAHCDLGQLDSARKLLDQLYALKRADWKQTLSFWDNEIAKSRVEASPVEKKDQIKVAMTHVEGPVWLKPTSPAAKLFPAKPANGLVVCFLGSSIKTPNMGNNISHQMSDDAGRLSRSLPMYLAEQIDFRTEANTKTLIPWAIGESSGFIVSGVQWDDENAADYARQVQGNYIVTVQIDATSEPWHVTLHLIRAIDGKCIGELQNAFTPINPEKTFNALADGLLVMLSEQAEIDPVTPPQIYQVPTSENFPYYLLRLEQLLAVRCGTMEECKAGFLSGERDILDGDLLLCLNRPQNIPVRLVLIQTLSAMKAVRPDVVAEFKDRVMLLQKEKPLQQSAQQIIDQMVHEIFMPS